ncbi:MULTISPECIES: hypothetical protein [unclassified Nocardioides]|nr:MULTISPECIES: hypothetical protein [unclassified Nocardioides]
MEEQVGARFTAAWAVFAASSSLPRSSTQRIPKNDVMRSTCF